MGLKTGLLKGMLDAVSLLAMNQEMKDGPFMTNYPKAGMSFNPDYKHEEPKRELRMFTIKGRQIEAYSKKDAIKRLKHQK